MLNNCFVFLFFLINCVTVVSALEGAYLHVVTIGDVAAKDLKDSILEDVKRIEQLTYEVATHTGLILKHKSFLEGKKLPQQIVKYLEQLKTEKEDVVLFFYSGHGYRTSSKKESPWPNMYFSGDELGLDLFHVAKILKKQTAHLIIVMADCCNNAILDFLAPPLVKSASMNSVMQQNYRKLFLESDAFITVSSSKENQFSYSLQGAGSLYTYAFVDNLRILSASAPTEVLDWQLVLDYAHYSARHSAQIRGVDQESIYEIEL